MPRKAPRVLMLSLALVTLSACQTPALKPRPVPPPPRGAVGVHAVNDDPKQAHYVVEDGETPVQPGVEAAPTPIYPVALIARRPPPVDIRARLVVDTGGRVSRVLFTPSQPADAVRAAFRAAVQEAVMRWRFTPLLMTRWKDLPDGGSVRVKATPMPFSQDYVFHFALVDGKPVVRTGS